MMKINIKYAITIALGLLLMCGCKYDDETVSRSTRYVRATENFDIISSSTSADADKALDFLTDSLEFSAEFTEEVSWTITITGLSHPTDHAEKVLQGTSTTIDPQNVFWDGASDNIYFFKKNEVVNIEFSVLGCETSINKSIFDGFSVLNTKEFNSVLILDFESSDSRALIQDAESVFLFFDTENKSEYLDSAQFVGSEFISQKGALPTPVQGNGLVYLRGIDLAGEPSAFFIGGFNHSPSIFGLDGPLDSIFVNLYVNSFGNRTTKMIVEIEGVGGDIFKSEKVITWDGWRLVSIKLSDMILGTAGSIGTGVLNPRLIKKMGVQIHSGDGAAKEGEILVDYINFTYGAPFKQSN